MRLEKFTKAALIQLYTQGFNIINYHNKISEKSTLWFLERIDDLSLRSVCLENMVVSFKGVIKVVSNNELIDSSKAIITGVSL